MIATRESYGKALAELGEKYKNIVVLDADLSNATKTIEFKKKFPDRFFNIGIAEQDLMGTAAGFASAGKFLLQVHLRYLHRGEHMTKSGILFAIQN